MLVKSNAIKFSDHPKGLQPLFFAEMWERFSFYGMRALLILYMTSQLLFSDHKAYGIYATYLTLLYTTPIIGGILADKFLGNQKAILMGSVIIICGHVCLAVSELSQLLFYFGLGFITAGTGLFKSNISTLVGKLYAKNDVRKDAGYTLFYVGVNLGGFLSPIVCGLIGELYGWHYGFGLAAIGMFFGLLTFVKSKDYFETHGQPPKAFHLRKRIVANFNLQSCVYIGIFLSVPALALLMQNYQWFDFILPVVGLCVLGYLLQISFKYQGSQRRALLTILVLMFFHTAFFSIFEQAGSSMNLFTERNVNRVLLGFEVPTTQFQALNPFFIRKLPNL